MSFDMGTSLGDLFMMALQPAPKNIRHRRRGYIHLQSGSQNDIYPVRMTNDV